MPKTQTNKKVLRNSRSAPSSPERSQPRVSPASERPDDSDRYCSNARPVTDFAAAGTCEYIRYQTLGMAGRAAGSTSFDAFPFHSGRRHSGKED